TLFACRSRILPMKGLAAVALAMAIALPACAQRGGGGHASFGGRSAPAARPAPAFHGGFAPSPAFHGGFSPSHGTFAASPPVHYSYGRSPLSRPPVSYPSSMRVPAPGVRYPVTTPPINRPNFYHPSRSRSQEHPQLLRPHLSGLPLRLSLVRVRLSSVGPPRRLFQQLRHLAAASARSTTRLRLCLCSAHAPA